MGFEIKRIRITGHSLGGALAILSAYHIAKNVPSVNEETIEVYTFGAPGLCNPQAKRYIERKVPCIFNVINNTDFVVYLGKYMHNVKHPGLNVFITSKGDLVIRPTKIEQLLRHFTFNEAVSDHFFASYQKSVACIIANNYEGEKEDLLELVNTCPPLREYLVDFAAEKSTERALAADGDCDGDGNDKGNGNGNKRDFVTLCEQLKMQENLVNEKSYERRKSFFPRANRLSLFSDQDNSRDRSRDHDDSRLRDAKLPESELCDAEIV